MTCIDCHQGIAHSLPAGHLEEYKKIADEFAADQLQSLDDGETRVSQLRSYLRGTDGE